MLGRCDERPDIGSDRLPGNLPANSSTGDLPWQELVGTHTYRSKLRILPVSLTVPSPATAHAESADDMALACSADLSSPASVCRRAESRGAPRATSQQEQSRCENQADTEDRQPQSGAVLRDAGAWVDSRRRAPRDWATRTKVESRDEQCPDRGDSNDGNREHVRNPSTESMLAHATDGPSGDISRVGPGAPSADADRFSSPTKGVEVRLRPERFGSTWHGPGG
jgi:hypothetical protein